LEELKRYRRNVVLLLCVIFISYIIQFAGPVPFINPKIIQLIFWLSLVLCLVIITSGVLKFSQKIGKLAYFFVLCSLIGAIFSFVIHTIDLIKELSFIIYYVGLFSSLITGVIAMVKEEKGLAKLSGFILMLLFALIILFSFILWNINGSQFNL